MSPDAIYVCSGQYCLIGVDVREESQVKEALGAAGLDWDAPTLILSEVVLTYMETKWYSLQLELFRGMGYECIVLFS